MLRVVAVLGFISLAAVSGVSATEPFDAHESYLEAERDFTAMRSELGLSGSAPLAGLEQARIPESVWDAARRDFEAVAANQGLSGSAPLFGLERYELTVRPQVAHVILANASVRGR
jgi:hypothetical protein